MLNTYCGLFTPRFVCERQDPNQAFKSCSIVFLLALLQIYCVYSIARAVSTGNAWLTKAVSTKTSANMFDHMEYIHISSRTTELKMYVGLFFKFALVCAVKPAFSEMIGNVRLQHDDIGCQHKSTSGRDYLGMANATVNGIPCQRWSDTEPIDHDFTYVGDHSFCRNPAGTDEDKVWCITNDTDDFSYDCAVPFCPPLKVVDLSQDNDCEPDANETYTRASLYKEKLPPSFTICLAFIMDNMGSYTNSPLFLLLDDNTNETWLFVQLFSLPTHTEFTIQFSDVGFTARSPDPFFPMQWMRVCLSYDSNKSMVTLAVDGEQVEKREVVLNSRPPLNLNMVLGWDGDDLESTGKFTDVNIFSTVLQRMQEMTLTGTGLGFADGLLVTIS